MVDYSLLHKQYIGEEKVTRQGINPSFLYLGGSLFLRLCTVYEVNIGEEKVTRRGINLTVYEVNYNRS